MKTLFLITVFLLLCRVLLAPGSKTFFIEKAKEINPYKRIINAIGKVESGHDTLAYNPFEQATGFFQVRPIRLKDFNQRTHSHLTMKDMFSYSKSEAIFLYYARQIGWQNPEKISRCWNGGMEKGMKYRQTAKYWDRVKQELL